MPLPIIPITTPAGGPFGQDFYGTNVWGSPGYKLAKIKLHATAKVSRANLVKISAKVPVKARYRGTEDTIEDIYASATYRALALGCLEGPILPYLTTHG